MPLPHGVERRQCDDAVPDAGRPAQVAVDVRLDPGRRTRRVVGERRGGVDDRTESMCGCGSTSIIVVIGFLDLGLGGARAAIERPADPPGVTIATSANRSITPAVDNNVAIGMRDGTALMADVHRPDSDVRVPALIAASPYPRQIQDLGAPMGFVEAGATDFWVPRGYAHVIANLRGIGGSGGTFGFFDAQERRDMHDLVEWVAAQPWCDVSASQPDAPVLPCRTAEAVPIGEDVVYRIPLVPNARRFQVGHRIQVMLTSDDQDPSMQRPSGFVEPQPRSPRLTLHKSLRRGP
jgi:predicted acyl esterase